MTETNVEQLPVIKDSHRRRVRLSSDSITWLIEQAERAEELERNIKLLEGQKGIKTALNNEAVKIIEEKDRVIDVMDGHLVRCGGEIIDKENERAQMQWEIDRLRETLAFYADNKNYEVNVVDQWGPEINIMMDGGEKADKLLGELK